MKSVMLTGQLVVEDGKVSLQHEDGSMTELDKRCRIEVFMGVGFEPTLYARIVGMVDTAGWPLYAGLYAAVEKPI